MYVCCSFFPILLLWLSTCWIGDQLVSILALSLFFDSFLHSSSWKGKFLLHLFSPHPPLSVLLPILLLFFFYICFISFLFFICSGGNVVRATLRRGMIEMIFVTFLHTPCFISIHFVAKPLPPPPLPEKFVFFFFLNNKTKHKQPHTHSHTHSYTHSHTKTIMIIPGLTLLSSSQLSWMSQLLSITMRNGRGKITRPRTNAAAAAATIAAVAAAALLPPPPLQLLPTVTATTSTTTAVIKPPIEAEKKINFNRKKARGSKDNRERERETKRRRENNQSVLVIRKHSKNKQK